MSGTTTSNRSTKSLVASGSCSDTPYRPRAGARQRRFQLDELDPPAPTGCGTATPNNGCGNSCTMRNTGWHWPSCRRRWATSEPRLRRPTCAEPDQPTSAGLAVGRYGSRLPCPSPSRSISLASSSIRRRFGVGIESGLHGVEQGGVDDCSMEPLVDLVLVRSATWAPGQGHSLEARGNLEAKLSMTASMSLMNTERSLT